MDGGGFRYDVFLSFRGPDVRKGFGGHLYAALKGKGLSAFIDSEDLEKGQRVDELLKIIEDSEVFVPIFSKGYADSTWCLREIAKIVECNRLILPVFFDVEPADVRRQGGTFKGAFLKHYEQHKFDEETVNQWRSALTKAGEISGYVLENDEAKLVSMVVKRIISELNRTPFHVATHPVGMDARTQQIMKLLDMETDNVRMVGIHGVGGIGKTTIAKAIYNEIFRKFECSSFIANIGQRSRQDNGIVALQNQLMSDLFNDRDTPIYNPDNGIRIITNRLRNRKALIVLDDVDERNQLRYLVGVGNLGKLHKGSRIIITTKNRRILIAHGVKGHDIYEPTEMDPQEALQLFSHHAFVNNKPTRDYIELSMEVVSAIGGLPLTLEVQGSLFFDLTTRKAWKEKLELLKNVQPEDAEKKLRISYDELDDEEQSIFLDIACFFVGKDKDNAMHMWKSCGFSPDSAVGVLMHRSLVNINEENGEFEMHDRIRDMGRNIVEEDWPSNPEKRTRLWNQTEILDVLQNSMGTDNIEGFDLKISTQRRLSTKAFGTMPNLKMLRTHFVEFQDDFSNFPVKIKWMDLTWCKLHSHSARFPSQSILIMKFDKLTILNLSNCESLVSTPDFYGVPSLVKLTLDCCVNLAEVHASIGCLKSLIFWSMKSCGALKELPSTCCHLTSLKILILKYCFTFTTLPKALGNMKSLTELILDNTRVSKLPDSTADLRDLCKLSLVECGLMKTLPRNLEKLESLKELMVNGTLIEMIPDSIGDLKKIEKINVASCVGLLVLPNSVCHLQNLRFLILDGNKIIELPDSLGSLEKLEILSLDGCEHIVCLPCSIGLLGKLETLSINDCKNLKLLPASIVQLTSLVNFGMARTSVAELPESFGSLSKLQVLDISQNPIEVLPESIVELKNLRSFIMARTRIKELPVDIGSLSKLRLLDLSYNCNLLELPPGFHNLTSLEELNASGVRWSETIAGDFGRLPSLKSLKLDNCFMRNAKFSDYGFAQLEELSLNSCLMLEFICLLPSSLVLLSARKCRNLEIILDISNLKVLRKLDLFGCVQLRYIVGFEALESIEDIDLLRCVRLGVAFRGQLKQRGVPCQYLKSFTISATLCGYMDERPYFEKSYSLLGEVKDQMILMLSDSEKHLFPDELDVQIMVTSYVGKTYELSQVAHSYSPGDDQITRLLKGNHLDKRNSWYVVKFEKYDKLYDYIARERYMIYVFPVSQASVAMAEQEIFEQVKILHLSSRFCSTIHEKFSAAMPDASTSQGRDEDLLVMIVPHDADWISPAQSVHIEVVEDDIILFRTVRVAHRCNNFDPHSVFGQQFYAVNVRWSIGTDLLWDIGKASATICVTSSKSTSGPLKWFHASSRFHGLVHRPQSHGRWGQLSFPIPRTLVSSELCIDRLVLKSTRICVDEVEIPIEVEIKGKTVLKVTMTATRQFWYEDKEPEVRYDDRLIFSYGLVKKEIRHFYYKAKFVRDNTIQNCLGHQDIDLHVFFDLYGLHSCDLYLEHAPKCVSDHT